MNAFIYFISYSLYIILIKCSFTAGTHWTYESNTTDWVAQYPQCNGYAQSPIDLKTSKMVRELIEPLEFVDYDLPMMKNTILRNNGETVYVEITPVISNDDESYPYIIITNGFLENHYRAVNVHFHWGSKNTKGSEHSINGKRYDAEVHMVHRNKKYETTDKAIQQTDGLVVLGIFLKMTKFPPIHYPGLEVIFDKLLNIRNYNDSISLERKLSLHQIVGTLNDKSFFTYNGSITTPPCIEHVRWFVYSKPLLVEREKMARFWQMRDENDQPLINNFRPIQRSNGRKVIYSPGKK